MTMKTDNKFLGFIKSFHIIPKLVCVFLAFILWIYVMEVDSPDYEDVFEDVAVTVVGTTQLENERNLSIFSGYDTLVDVTVKGQKSVIAKYSSEDIVATVDVSKIEKSGMYTLEVFVDVPSGMTLVESSVTQINMFVDKRTTENIPVEASVKSYKISSEEYSLGDITCSTDMISVTGPESVIREIDHGLVEVDLGGEFITKSITTEADVLLKSQNGEDIESRYLKLSKTSIQVNVPVYGFKNVPLRVTTKNGFYTEKLTDVTVSPEIIKVKGEPSVLQNVDSIDVTVIDEKRIGENTQLEVDIILPDNVYPVTGEPETATVNIKLSGLVRSTFEVENITIINTGDKKVKALDKSVAVTVIAEKSIMKKLKAEDITLVVDFTNFKENIGIVNAVAEVQFNTDDGVVYEIGVYSIQIQAK